MRTHGPDIGMEQMDEIEAARGRPMNARRAAVAAVLTIGLAGGTWAQHSAGADPQPYADHCVEDEQAVQLVANDGTGRIETWCVHIEGDGARLLEVNR